MFIVFQKTECNKTRVNIKTVIAGQTIDTHQRRIHEKSRWIQGKYFKITQRSSLYVNRINQIFWKWHCFLMNENEFCFLWYVTFKYQQQMFQCYALSYFCASTERSLITKTWNDTSVLLFNVSAVDIDSRSIVTTNLN